MIVYCSKTTPRFLHERRFKTNKYFFPTKDRQITQQTSRRPVQNSNIGVAGNSNFEDDDDFFNNVDMPEDVPLQRVVPKSGSFWQEFVQWKFEKVTITFEFGAQ